MGLPEMLELQASYEEAVQELRGLEVEREALLFQVDVLQDTLEGVEELLAEAQREAGQASLELEREKEAKRKLESMVHSLTQEVERLKEERNNQLPGPESEMDKTTNLGHQIRKDAHEVLTVESSSTSHESQSSNGGLAATMERGQNEGTVEKQWRMVNKLMGHQPSLALENLVSEDGVLRRSYENGAAEGRDASPDRNDSDSVSAYEDASADTPEQHRIFPGDGDTLELPHDSENSEKNLTNNGQPLNSETQGAKNNESCVVS